VVLVNPLFHSQENPAKVTLAILCRKINDFAAYTRFLPMVMRLDENPAAMT
jgi:hypothetical protein